MVTVYCALVGAAGESAFPVDIDESQSIGHLKKAIKAEKPNKIKCDANQLQLFSAKQDGAWLTESAVKDVRDTTGLTHLDAARATLGFVLGLSKVHVEAINEAKEAAGDGPVHVLVVVPAEQLMTISSQHLAIPNIGKTQMVFNLQAQGDCEVFYIVCGEQTDREQHVYDAFGTRTKTFLWCIKEDACHLINGSIGDIKFTSQLNVYGFLLAALRGDNEFKGPATRDAVDTELERRNARGAKPFVVFLDEFPRAGRIKTHLKDKDRDEQEKSLCIKRNVFRSFDLAVVVSSTNGTARNLLTTSDRSRQGTPYLWCVVCPSLPRVALQSDADEAGVPVTLMKIIEHSRPLFAQVALAYVQANPFFSSGHNNLRDYLNAMVCTLATQFSSLKKRSDEFEMGQLCLLFCTSYEVVDSNVNMIDGHFARLCEQSAFELKLDTNGALWKGDEAWTCRCVLPPPEEDMLLHLTMTGGPSFHPLKQPLHQFMASTTMQPPVRYDNTNQRSNDGMHLEDLTAAAIVVASHVGGFGGVPFPTFLHALLVELGVCEMGRTVQLPRDVQKAGGGTLIVPFLSPPNESWPQWLAHDSSMNFADLVRTCNKDRIDFRTTSNFISDECKDYSSAVKLDVVEKIMTRIPDESTVHVVVARTLQAKYLTAESSWDVFVREQDLENVDVYRISGGPNGPALREIRGMHNQSPAPPAAAPIGAKSSSTATTPRRIDKLVIFIELAPRS